MRTSSCLAVIALVAAPAAFAQQPAGGALAAQLRERLAVEEGGACAAVAVVEKTTTFVFECNDAARATKLDAAARLEVGSIGKALAGLLLADMVRKGEVSLDDPAAKYARPGAKLPSRNGRQITLRDLVTQTSALPRIPPNFQAYMGDAADPYGKFTVDALYEGLAQTVLARDPGDKYEYSNFGFMWLSELLGRAGGKRYDQLLEERVLRPLGMTGVAYRPTAPGHDGHYRPVAPWTLAPELAGVGGMSASIADMAKLAEALAGRRKTPLDETFALALKPQRPAGGPSSIGYAWMTTTRGDVSIQWHNGATGGFRSIIAANPATKTAVVVLVDAAQELDDFAFHLLDPSRPLKKKRATIAIDAARLPEYEGSYALSPTFSLRVLVADGRLMTQGPNQPAIEIYAEAPDRFFARKVDAQLVFARDAAGKVVSLTLFQAGRHVTGAREPLTSP